MKKFLIAALLCTGLAFTANAQQGTTTQQPTKAKHEASKGHEHHATKGGRTKHGAMKQTPKAPAEKPAATPAKPAATPEPKKK